MQHQFALSRHYPFGVSRGTIQARNTPHPNKDPWPKLNLFGPLVIFPAQMIHSLDHWDVAEALPLGWQVTLIAAGFIAGSALSSYWHGLRRLLVSGKDMNAEVHRSVHAVFSSNGVGGTMHDGGLLIYLVSNHSKIALRPDQLGRWLCELYH